MVSDFWVFYHIIRECVSVVSLEVNTVDTEAPFQSIYDFPRTEHCLEHLEHLTHNSSILFLDSLLQLVRLPKLRNLALLTRLAFGPKEDGDVMAMLIQVPWIYNPIRELEITNMRIDASTVLVPLHYLQNLLRLHLEGLKAPNGKVILYALSRPFPDRYTWLCPKLDTLELAAMEDITETGLDELVRVRVKDIAITATAHRSPTSTTPLPLRRVTWDGRDIVAEIEPERA